MKRKEKKAEVGGKEGEKEADRKPAAKTISQIPKKTSPKKPLVPVKEEPSNLTKDARRGNCKYNCKCQNFNCKYAACYSQFTMPGKFLFAT